MKRILALILAAILGGCLTNSPKPNLPPTVTTTVVSSITGRTALSGGNVISDGGSPVIIRGICWSYYPGPTREDNTTNDGTGTGEFESKMTGLPPFTKIYARAYARNREGTHYGDQVEFVTLHSFIRISAGGNYSVALRTDNSIWTWGRNDLGQLGDGTLVDKLSPVFIGDGYRDISAGKTHVLALTTTYTLWAWGSNYYGALGDGTNTLTQGHIKVGDGFIEIAAGSSWSLAIKLDGTLWAWGENSFGQLGDGTTNDSYVPIKVGTNFRLVAAGDTHSIGIKKDGTLWIWGGDINSLGSHYAIPTQVGTGYTMVSASTISAGDAHSLAVNSNGTVYSWGLNTYGQLGYGNNAEFNVPTLMAPGYYLIVAGAQSSFGIKGFSLYAWGNNQHGQIGTGTVSTSVLSPVLVGDDFQSVASNGLHVLAIRRDGFLWSWGLNLHGELGIGNTVEMHTPQLIAPF